MDEDLENSNIYPTGLVLVKPTVQYYSWGLPSDESFVYRLYLEHNDLNSTSSSLPEDHWAELWLGTHPKGPATVLLSDGQEPLSAHLKRMQSISPRETNESEYLGFLLKVLAIGEPLSIQVHPDSIVASQLCMTGHASITDNCAKSEFFIALTEFEALYSLRTLESILNNARKVPEFFKLLKNSECADVLEFRNFSDEATTYHHVVSIVKTVISEDVTILEELTTRLEAQSELDELEALMLRVHKIHPNDPGIWFVLLMNYLKLKPGESVYVPPNTLHCYLSGTCIECMMSSDNVIRAGLTKKYVDPQLLPSCLLRTHNKPETLFINSLYLDSKGFVSLYKVDDSACNLSVVRITLPPGESVTYSPPPTKKCSVAIIISSNTKTTLTTLNEAERNRIAPNVGTCLLIYPNTTISVKNAAKNTSSELPRIYDYTLNNDWFIMFIAYTNS